MTPQPTPPDLTVQLPNLRSLRGCPSYGAFKRRWRKAGKRRDADTPAAPRYSAAQLARACAAGVPAPHIARWADGLEKPLPPIRAMWARMAGGLVSLRVARLALELLEPASPAALAAQDAIDAALWADAAEGLGGR